MVVSAIAMTMLHRICDGCRGILAAVHSCMPALPSSLAGLVCMRSRYVAVAEDGGGGRWVP